MASKIIKGEYVEYYPSQYFRNKADEFYSDEKFEESYRNNPDRMTPNQIKLCGYDMLRSTLWEKYIDKKYESIHIAEFETAKMVLEQIIKPIKEITKSVKVETTKGEIKKGYNTSVTFPKIIIGDIYDEEHGGLRIFITLSNVEDKMFQIDYNTPYLEGNRYCNDVELIGEIAKYVKFVKSGLIPTSYPDKVCHWVDNQYELYSGKNCIKLYDVEFVQMYNTLAKICNEKFGTEYPYSQKMIDKLMKHDVFGNIQKVGGFYLKDTWYNDKFRLNQFYFYDSCGRCETTYGDDWTKKDILGLIAVLRPYVMNNWFVETSCNAMRKKYGDYDKIGIGYSRKPKYFEDMLWED